MYSWTGRLEKRGHPDREDISPLSPSTAGSAQGSTLSPLLEPTLLGHLLCFTGRHQWRRAPVRTLAVRRCERCGLLDLIPGARP